MYSIAIGITTRNRRSSFYLLLESLAEFMPPNCKVFVVNDASEVSYGNPDFTFNERVGISRVKNKALQLCHESQADSIFLFDDDVRVLCKDWHLPYVNSSQHHLCRTFYKPVRIHGDIAEHRLSNGCAMYFTRHCIDTVGGFDTNYRNKFEHIDLSRRIHNAGLTKWMHQDIISSDKLIYCMDEKQEIARSFSKKEMNEALKDGHDYFVSQSRSKEFKEFRT